jgi:RNA polymerase sigma-70 factor (ECF subfamily)
MEIGRVTVLSSQGGPPARVNSGHVHIPVCNVTREFTRNLIRRRDRLTLSGAESNMSPPSTTPDITALLRAWGEGDVQARDELLPFVYAELRSRAQAYMRRESPGHVLDPTALVHEVYLRLVKQERVDWANRSQFFGLAAQMMRRILVDRARARKMAKRSGQWTRVSLAEFTGTRQPQEVDLLDLHSALEELAAFDERKVRVVELKFFGGLSLEETGQLLGVSLGTVEREWQAARAWLYARLKKRTL